MKAYHRCLLVKRCSGALVQRRIARACCRAYDEMLRRYVGHCQFAPVPSGRAFPDGMLPTRACVAQTDVEM